MDIVTPVILAVLTIITFLVIVVLVRVTYTLWKAMKPKGRK